MHPLTIGERLLMARCSKAMMRAACSPFAWRGVTLPIETSEAERLAKLSQGCVLQHIPLALVINSLTTFAQLCALLNGALARSVLRELDARQCSTELAWPHILIQPQMEHLGVLYLSGLNRRTLVNPEFAHLITALPALETLHMAPDALPMLRHPPSDLPASFPSLRSLQLSSSWGPAPLTTQPLHTAFCANCPNQTELKLERPPLILHTFLPTFQEPHMPRIQRLHLYRWHPSEYLPRIAEVEMSVALANMRSLHTLIMERCSNYAMWMRNLQHAPALELLEIICHDPGHSERLFSVAEIAAMLIACPRMRFRWTLLPSSDHPKAADRKHWLEEKQRFREEPQLVMFGPRFMMLDCEADLDNTASSPKVRGSTTKAADKAAGSAKVCVVL